MLRAFGIADEGTRMSDRVEARRTPRFKTSRALRIIPPEGEAILGTMQDISLGGMLVAVPVEVELGRTYRIEVTDSEGVFYLHGEALRLHLPPPLGRRKSGIGIQDRVRIRRDRSRSGKEADPAPGRSGGLIPAPMRRTVRGRLRQYPLSDRRSHACRALPQRSPGTPYLPGPRADARAYSRP